ncbi:prolyl oligopeptidase family serine peptidase [Fimbriiglobus ruber]|uniref:Peptidase S9 prolyl oligopeptidase catalytic domain-containing protein n=1 Tax=Fimbriiglobus ruber TaxID=1908690 RepID=A0A225D4V3_9BACT|nr:PHB depolymerase family esterase [Fimbriiglobus ruber]OWK36631.1 hypothetical protein FRUB_09194 [Fimbriiglobus ruber]
MATGANTIDPQEDSAAEAVAERLGEFVPPRNLPYEPSLGAVVEWITKGIEAGFTRAFVVNVETCVGAQCASAVLAELEQRGATAGDRAFVAAALVDTGAQSPLQRGPLSPVLADVLHATVDAVLQQIVAASREGSETHARCARLEHAVVVLFDHHEKLNWLFAGAKHKVRDALAKAGCDPRVALTQDLDLAQGGKLFLPGYEVIVTRRRKRLHAQTRRLGGDAPREPHAAVALDAKMPDPKTESARRPRRWPAWAFLGRLTRAVGVPIRWLRSVELSPHTLGLLPVAIFRYIRAHRTVAAIGVCMAAALACLTLVATDVYGNLSGETVAPKRPPGFYVGQYNKAGPWGTDLRPYGLYIPPHFRGQRGPFPLIVYLHGWGERNPNSLFSAGLPLSIATRFGEGTKNGRFEFVALFLNDPSGYWDPDTQEGKDAIEVLDYVITRHRIDPQRVYLTGASSGGAGVWRYAEAYPDRWAALAPLGAVYTPSPGRVKQTPAWIFHGEKDTTAPIKIQRGLIKKLREVGCDVRFTEFAGKDHTVSSETYDNRELFTWFAEKKR